MTNGWHPIETMPFDRVRVVGWLEPNVTQYGKTGVVFHWAIAKRRQNKYWCKPWWRFTFEVRSVITYADSHTREIGWKPTHWRNVVDLDNPPPLEIVL